MNSNISLIIGREYWTRVKSKTFLLTTFLAPIGIVFVYAVLGYLLTRGSDKQKNIAILDNAGIVSELAEAKNNLVLTLETKPLTELLEDYKEGKYDGIVELPALDIDDSKYSIIYHSDDPLALDEESTVRGLFRKDIRNFKVQAFGLDQNSLDKIDTDISLNPKTVKETEKEISNITTKVSSVLGGAVGMILFMVILIFGSQVMRGVNEEKINRIVEVLISSVKPLDLMIGKVLGIGLVGLTQFMIWGILLTVFSVIASSVFGLGSMETMGDMASNEGVKAVMENDEVKGTIMKVLKELASINWLLIIPLYFFYFIIGYLMYASLFAAVGAAAGDDINEAQALTTVVMLPLIAAFYIGMSAVSAPDSSVSVWSSIIPITAPVVMPIRLATDPPMWQIGLSVISCILFVVFLIWLAARIYRVGILMYGKKASFKELGKWIFYKG